MAYDHGTDFLCVEDIDPNLTVVSGRTCLAQALTRRLMCQRGQLFYDENYGTDVRQFVNSVSRDSVVSQAVENECLKDERVQAVTCTVTRSNDGETFELSLQITDLDGEFPLTVAVSSLTVELLEENL